MRFTSKSAPIKHRKMSIGRCRWRSECRRTSELRDSASAHQQPSRDATRRSGREASCSSAPHRPRARPLQRLKRIDRIWTHTRIGTVDPAALATGRDGAPSRGGTATAAPAALAHGVPAALADGGSGTAIRIGTAAPAHVNIRKMPGASLGNQPLPATTSYFQLLPATTSYYQLPASQRPATSQLLPATTSYQPATWTAAQCS